MMRRPLAYGASTHPKPHLAGPDAKRLVFPHGMAACKLNGRDSLLVAGHHMEGVYASYGGAVCIIEKGREASHVEEVREIEDGKSKWGSRLKEDWKELGVNSIRGWCSKVKNR